MSIALSTNPTPPHCPPWCKHPAGHGWEFDLGNGVQHRQHEMSVDCIGAEAGLVEVFIEKDEDSIGTPFPTEIHLYGTENDSVTGPHPLTADQARMLATVLLDAADELDKITGSAS